MAAAKSSRSRPGAAGGGAARGVNAHELSAQLEEKLTIFKTDRFDPDAYVQSKCQTMNEMVRFVRFCFFLFF